MVVKKNMLTVIFSTNKKKGKTDVNSSDVLIRNNVKIQLGLWRQKPCFLAHGFGLRFQNMWRFFNTRT